MKATEARFLDFIKKSPQFIIPIYQRTYSWTREECQQLWNDIIRAGEDAKVNAHFVGSIVYIEKGLYQVSSQSSLLVIDGQQRLTTLLLLITVLTQFLETLPDSEREPLDGFSPRKLRNYYLINPEEEGERYYKLLLSQTDKETLITLIHNDEAPHEASVRILDNYDLFKRLVTKEKILSLCKGIAKLIIVDIALNREQDNPQLIFESMNSTGRELTQADLIRNYILMGLEPKLQTRLYERYWRPMERDFGQDGYNAYFDSFMRHYLTVKTGEIPRLDDVYTQFKRFVRSSFDGDMDMETIVKDIRQFSQYFCAMALGTEPDPQLKDAFHDLRELKVDVAYPLLLELYNDYVNKILSQADFLTSVRMIESYVFRRAICSIPTNSMNKTFATMAKSLKKDHYLESMQAYFLALPSYRRFPTDDEFKREFQIRDLYNFPRRSYWLRRIENHGRKERVPVDEYTIEHILPQNKNLSPAWRTMLGAEWEQIQATYLHTLGNLTLTGYNAEYSDKPFLEKRDMAKGFRHSPLRLNEKLGNIEQWNEASIRERSLRLSTLATTIWQYPDLNPSIVTMYRDKKERRAGYTRDDHPYLLSGPSKDLFELLRHEILAIDPVVSEEFFKLYVAYKAETNFVDIVPQAKRLRLSLNMPFADIHDPRNLCKDVSNLGRWGNGDVEIGFSDPEDLSYIMGLIRQSFAYQMVNDTVA